MSQDLLVDGFMCAEKTSQFNKDYIKNCNEDSDAGYFLETDVQYLEKLHELQNNSLFFA